MMEFATGSDPWASNSPAGELVKNENSLEFTYTRRKDALQELSFLREFSETMGGTWSKTGSPVETILSDDGVIQRVQVNTPAGTTGKRYIRLRVTRQ